MNQLIEPLKKEAATYSAQILAVSKLQPIEKIEAAYHQGLRHFGENYVQELKEKKLKLSHLKEIKWHLIGPLQTNKVKIALECADYFHALDSEKLIHEISKRSKTLNKKPWPVFIQINFDNEKTKNGIAIENIKSFVQLVNNESSLNLLGFMCIPEPKENAEDMRIVFKTLKKLKDSINPKLQLSMGMSHDYKVALQEGANWIRVGTKIFGERK